MIGETGGTSAKTVFVGFGIAFVFKYVMSSLRLWSETIAQPIQSLKGATFAMDTDVTLLGVGYIIGTRIACIMVAGGILSWLVLCPIIAHFDKAVDNLDSEQMVKYIYDNYTVYIGAGAVAAGGILSMIRAMPLILASIIAGLRDLRPSGRIAGESSRRTDRDMSIRFVLFGSLVLVTLLWIFLGGRSASQRQLFLCLDLSELGQSAGLCVDRAVRVPLRHGFLPFDGRNRFVEQSDLRHDYRHPAADMLDLPHPGLDRPAISPRGHFDRGRRLRGVEQRRHNLARPEDGLPRCAAPKWQQWAILVGTVSSALVIGVVLLAMTVPPRSIRKKTSNNRATRSI